MKTRITLLAFFVAVLFTSNAQQLPNPSFDLWTTDTLAPNGWSTYESLFHANIGHAEKDASDKLIGAYSLKITSDSVPNLPTYGVLAGACGLGKAYNSAQGPAFRGEAFAFRPDTLIVLYKFNSPGTDSGLIFISMNKAGSSVFGHPVYGAGVLLPPSGTQWIQLTIAIDSGYNSTNTPDTLRLNFYSSKNPGVNGGVQGSVLHVDGVLFGYVTLPNALQEVADKLNFSVYPNPATDLITISTEENTTGFRAVISDINGKIVSANTLEGQKTSINVAEFANGTYIYRIADAQGNILKQNRFTVVK